MSYRDSHDLPEPPREPWMSSERAPPASAPFRLPTEMPLRPEQRENRRLGVGLSIALHALIVVVLLLPVLLSPAGRAALARGAGGAGPAGGGGGGSLGPREGLRYIQVAPAPAPARQEVVPPVLPPITPPVAAPPVAAPPVAPPEATESPPATPAPETTSAADAGGGGSGASPGTGPGTGGGVGAGVGTGTGSATGPGTGGGSDTVHSPQPTQVFIPPLPVPAKIRPFRLVAVFDVDSTGAVLRVTFNETRDGGYNRRLKDVLTRIRFRPGVLQNGRPIRATTEITYSF